MKRIRLYIIIGIIFVLVTGTLAHFVYGWTGENRLAGLFFAVNESTWEHMKLCFFPMLVYAVFMGGRLERENVRVVPALLTGTLLSTWLVPVIFYTYSGILGTNYMALDILTFVVSVLLGFLAIWKISTRQSGVDVKYSDAQLSKFGWILGVLVAVQFACFLLFSYAPPELGIFVNPVE